MLPFGKRGHAISTRPRLLLVAFTLCAALAATGGPLAVARVDTTTAPHFGGVVTTAVNGLGILDPDATGAIADNNGISVQILGALFLPAASPTAHPVADLATGYRYNRSGTAVTITLRRGVRFTDNTPFNPKAVIWNFRHLATSGAADATLLSGMAGVVQSGPNTVTITFSAPNYAFISACITSAVCDMESPTAYNLLGPTAFATAPVGAGPFRVVASTTGKVVLGRNLSYWDARHVYLERWTIVDAGSDPGQSYQSVIEDTAQGAAFGGMTTQNNLLFLMSGNHNVAQRSTPNTDYSFLPLNAYKAPFSDQRAREALDYCIDRVSIAKHVTSGYASPAYVLAGAASEYLPRPGGWRGAQTLMPYKFNIAQSEALVAQLGGLSFQLDVPSNAASEAVASALAAQWSICGIHATIQTSPNYQLTGILQQGSYQAAYVVTPGALNPASSIALEAPVSPLEVPGFTDTKLSGYIQAAAATNSPTRLASLWHQIWYEENIDAINLPVLSSGSTVLVSHCLSDYGYAFGLSLVHASLACQV